MSAESISEVLTTDIKLEELETKLASVDNDYKARVMGSIQDTQNTILPIRLLFNDFIQSMSNVESLEGETQKEKFMRIRSKIMELSSKLQDISDDFTKLQPLFDTIQEYSVKYDNKKYQPLETLKSPSFNGVAVTTNSAVTTANTNNNVAGTNATANSNKKGSRSNGGTPINISTPGGSTPTSAPATKKPRKPRQTKKTVANNSKSQSHPASMTGTPPTNGLGSTPGAAMPIMGSMPPTNMMGSPLNTMASPLGTTFAVHPQSQPQSHLQPQVQSTTHIQDVQQPTPQPQQQRQQHQFNPPLRNNAVSQSHLNMNNITPANILNMTMAQDAQHTQMPPQPVPQQQQQPQQPQQPQQSQNSNKDLDPMDFNNFDLWNINMDMI